MLVAVLLLLATSTVYAQSPRQSDEDDRSETASVPAGHDGSFFVQSEAGDFRLRLGGRLQTQYNVRLDESGDDLEVAESRFRIRRARFKLDGHAFTERLTYVLQPELSGDSVELLDFFTNYAFAPGVFEATLGQWRLPFLRQELTSSGSLMLVDRSPVTEVFGEGYDVGMAVHNGYGEAPPFEWVVGVFNGTKSSLDVVNVDDPYAPTMFYPTLVGRVAYNHGGIDAYQEVDFDKGPLRFSVGASGLTQLGVDREEQSAMKATVDYMLKIRGFSSSGAYMIAGSQNGEGLFDQSHRVSGLFAQAGYLIGDTFQPAVRYSRLAYANDGPVRHEALGGVNVFFYGHDLKWQTDAGALIDETGTNTETGWQARTQLQLSF